MNTIIMIIITTTIIIITMNIIIMMIITNVSIEADPVILPMEGAGPLTDSSSARAAMIGFMKIYENI